MLAKIQFFTLMLIALFASSAIAASFNFAIHTDAHPWDKADAEKEVDKFVQALDGKVNLEVFDADARKQLADWVEAHTAGGGNTLILTGITPSTLYPSGNAKPDGSILEEFLDAGNSIFNTGEYTFYTSEGPQETNEEQGLPNIIDVPEAFVWHGRGAGAWQAGTVVMTPTADGKKYAPSLKEYGTSYPFHVEDYAKSPWELEIALAENKDDDLRVEPAVIVNKDTDGRLGIFVQAYVGDIPHPGVSWGDIMSEFIINFFVPEVLAVEPTDKLATTWGEIKLNR